MDDFNDLTPEERKELDESMKVIRNDTARRRADSD